MIGEIDVWGEDEDTSPEVSRIDQRVEVTILVEDPRTQVTATRPAFGRVVGMDMIGVLVEGETIPRAFERRHVKRVP